MRRFARENGLSLAFFAFFAATLGAQSVAGLAKFNDDLQTAGRHSISYGHYVTSSEFGRAVLENWQSEFLQFTLYILLTVHLLQKGSNESKELDRAGRESDEQQKVGAHAQPDSPAWAKVDGARRWLLSNSLVLVMGAIWLASWFGQSVTGWSAFNSQALREHTHRVSWVGYLGSADFWEATLQNWQSEFLAVGSMAVFSIYLRQRGSPESKPVGAPHAETAASG